MGDVNVINEIQIEEAIASLDSSEKVQKVVENLGDEEPKILAFVFGEDFELLKTSEKELLTFIVSVFWSVVADNPSRQDNIKVDYIAKSEENNWRILEEEAKKNIKTCFDIFYENNEQEEMLALVEDLLSSSEEEELSKEGKEIILVKCKTLIDCFFNRSN